MKNKLKLYRLNIISYVTFNLYKLLYKIILLYNKYIIKDFNKLEDKKYIAIDKHNKIYYKHNNISAILINSSEIILNDIKIKN